MSPEELSRRYLSLRCWLRRSVLPAALLLLLALGVIATVSPDERARDHLAALVAFTALYFTLFRGGHLIMIRSLHIEMMRHYEDAYREKLSLITDVELDRKNLGFTLAKLKRDILVEDRKPKF